ncbi:DUF1963 domain-containing protein [Sphingomicrobium astaxanthinifaciens]|uniref:DUF1963 domain-containing protein n=1 Tax=Sphingomicrobium astaxanthinifaciens TaxID=1227949 RepID=UPI001FCAE4E9|nr:DUF1963 domain-containing protein [Sphingomicrobium astaxanthinifaciens]MCJ7422027.1 DUF1963 domain-containing protein [Sphingomicrobium astaxanthinifaciens]
MIRKTFGKRRSTPDHRDAPEQAATRLARLAGQAQEMAAEEKFAKPPKLPPRPARPAPRPAEDAATAPPESNEVHDLQDRIETELAPVDAIEPLDAATAPAAPPRPRRAHPALRRAREQAVMFRQHLPPLLDHGSHWGGVPQVPEGFEWPTFTTPEGEERALSFIASLDCAEVPAAASFQLLPASGRLLFFMDLHWGAYWQWKVVHVAADQPLAPAALPHLYESPAVWGWPSTAEDWPRLLPYWSFEPVVLHARPDRDEMQDQPFWPGAIDRDTAAAQVATLESELGDCAPFKVSLDAQGKPNRPFEAFPASWRSIRIACGHLARLQASAERPGNQKEAKALAADLKTWRGKIERAHKAGRDLSRTAANDFWKLLRRHHKFSAPCLEAITVDAIEASLSAGEPVGEAALAMVRHRHRFSAGDARAFSAPTFVQMEAEERVGEWLLLLELGANIPIGHHFDEGVYQYWIRPEDLAAGNFDAVELTAETY